MSLNKLPLISFVIGTRPEAIKMAPVIKLFKNQKNLRIRILLTGQHKLMVKQVMDLFELVPDLNLKIMKKGQSLSYITASILKGFKKESELNRPDLIFVQGDTSSAFSVALAAFYEKIPVAHIEAGLRTEDVLSPFPEELNRRLISQIASIHFAPTENAKQNLIKDNIKGIIKVTGNTVIDALFMIANKADKYKMDGINLDQKRLILATIHRRENWGENLNQIVIGIKRIVESYNDVIFLIPMHSNPILRKSLITQIGNHERIFLTEPLKYDNLVSAIKSSKIIITDSGGLQEEAPAFGKPVLVVRDNTERKEAIDAGVALLVGTNSEEIFNQASLLLNNEEKYNLMSRKVNPFGDGKASLRILKTCKQFFNLN